MLTLLWLALFVGLIGILAFNRAPLWLNTAAVAAYLVLISIVGNHPWPWDVTLWVIFLGIAIPLNAPVLRRLMLTKRLFIRFQNTLPSLSDTETAALEAGTVWWDAELFTGRPDWRKLLAYPLSKLSEEERAFLDGPVETLCRMVDDWDVTHNRLDLPPQAWLFLREQGFFGLIIPKEYGGKGFSALAHSEITMKLASHCNDLGSTVMVPNSLGPAELLIRYGTEQQRDHYLPRLARGEEIPCFALTGPEAGSDASSIPDKGIVCKGNWNGEQIIGLRLNWEKRYITLGPIATLLGLAFKAYDPDHLLGEQEELGITLALIPTYTPGVEIGRRHFPLNAAFMNGPNRGHNVFIPLAWIIGGPEHIGQGWVMLMDCLAVGRSISLPSGATALAKKAALTSGGYTRIRRQFQRPIGEFEGVQEALARIGSNTYVMDAARKLTVSAIDRGEEPAVLSAVVKYHLTERMRACINDAMDIQGGKGICLGPNNYLGRAYQTAPISITVEGSNILTRSMMIFGQGALRAHPYLLAELLATRNLDPEAGHAAFDRLLVKHVGWLASNAARAFLLGISRGWLTPGAGAIPTRHYYRQLSRMAAAFALTADVCMLVLGRSLKRRERISARLGDLLSYLYLASATLKRYEDQGCPRSDLPLVQWGVEDALHVMQSRLDEILKNLPTRTAATLLRLLIFPGGRWYRPPADAIGSHIARLLMQPGEGLERLVAGVYRSADPGDATGQLEDAWAKVIAAEPIERKVDEARRLGSLRLHWRSNLIEAASKAGVISSEEAEILRQAEQARRNVIRVDDFEPQELIRATDSKRSLAPEQTGGPHIAHDDEIL
ncbi:acyl-CoA dehydrogenase [Nitrococcus mobilis]|uniref:Acyl-coenzyme A dehydrogenase n=1 Tax=Nitrococcus mobilis Nb-231 TaxID=314278 RepID=A4BQ61_9GAMM|nr:acyl-CoA dehydrogenase [Nitrococcus mobilis]EAR22216.1 probable acyl-CoA dehydrogenase [Nitrococcus mobilis Nb-231]